MAQESRAPGTRARVCSSSLRAREEATQHQAGCPDPGGVWALSRAIWEEVSLWLCWGPDPLLEGPTHPQDFPSSEAPVITTQDSSWQGQVGMSWLLCVPGGCPPAPLVRGPCRVLFSRHRHRVQWGAKPPRGSKCLWDTALFK